MADRGASFAQFVERSLALLREEAPEHFQRVREHARGLRVDVSIDRETPVRLQLDSEPWTTRTPATEAHVYAEIRQSNLIAILEGVLAIDEAIEAERLQLRGQLDHLLSFLEALRCWFHGAVRAPSFPALHAEYLAAVADRSPARTTTLMHDSR